MEAQWVDVKGYESLFQVSDDGKIYSKRTKRILKPYTANGYHVLATKIGGRAGQAILLRIHRLVADAFLPAPSDELMHRCASQGHGQVLVRHKDGNKTNNKHQNLCWGSSKDNYDDFSRTDKFGEWSKKVWMTGKGHHSCKLDASQVLEIRSKYIPWSRDFGLIALGRIYGVSRRTIEDIVSMKTYGDVLLG